MTSAFRDLLRSFQLLSDAEQREATSLLQRQVVQSESGEIGEDALIAPLKSYSSNWMRQR